MDVWRCAEFSAGQEGDVGSPRIFFEYFPQYLTIITAVVLYRAVMGRADIPHLEYSTIGIILALIACAAPMLLRADEKITVESGAVGRYVQPVVIIVFCLVLCVRAAAGSIVRNFPVNMPDSAYLTSEYQQTIAYLKANMKPGDGFLTLTNEASWYYFLDKPSPVRFNLILFAAPDFFQKEVVGALSERLPEFVLYRNGHWASRLNERDIDASLPQITGFIRSRYRPDTTIGSQELWRLAEPEAK
jgi:hypothetical protein